MLTFWINDNKSRIVANDVAIKRLRTFIISHDSALFGVNPKMTTLFPEHMLNKMLWRVTPKIGFYLMHIRYFLNIQVIIEKSLKLFSVYLILCGLNCFGLSKMLKNWKLGT